MVWASARSRKPPLLRLQRCYTVAPENKGNSWLSSVLLQEQAYPALPFGLKLCTREGAKDVGLALSPWYFASQIWLHWFAQEEKVMHGRDYSGSLCTQKQPGVMRHELCVSLQQCLLTADSRNSCRKDRTGFCLGQHSVMR